MAQLGSAHRSGLLHLYIPECSAAVACSVRDAEVVGSIPTTPTIKMQKDGVVIYFFSLARELKHLARPSKENSNSPRLFSGRWLAPRGTGALSGHPDQV